MAIIRFYEIQADYYGYHADELSTDTVSDFQKSFIVVQAFYFVNSVLTKSSLLYLFYRIFGVSARFTWFLWSAWTLVMIYFVAALSLAVGGCHPSSYFWDKSQQGTCIDEVNFFRWNGIVNMLLDVMVLVLPQPMVWRLNLRLRQKLILTSIFLLGTL